MRQALALALRSLPGSTQTVLRHIAQKHRISVVHTVEAVCGRPVHFSIPTGAVTGALTDLGVMLCDEIRHVVRDVPALPSPHWDIDVQGDAHVIDERADALGAKLREAFDDDSLPVSIELIPDRAWIRVRHRGDRETPNPATVGESLRLELLALCGLKNEVQP